jgi:hypothetical protein
LNLTDDLAAGGFGFEQLPDEAFEGQAQVEDAIAAVIYGVEEFEGVAVIQADEGCVGGERETGWG